VTRIAKASAKRVDAKRVDGVVAVTRVAKASAKGVEAVASQRATIDGIPVKVEDVVWFVRPGSVTRRSLHKTDLGMWWEAWTSKQIYATERAALGAAIERESLAAKSARREVRRAEAAICRFVARQGGLS
jgi:hypothetical protein